MKNLAKKFLPPYFYELIRKFVKKQRKFKPVWNTLSYDPMNGVRVFFDPTGPWQKKMMGNTYDKFLFDILKSMDLKGKVIFDIGAHIGFHSLYFAKLVGDKGRVYSFEPNLVNFERFNLILSKNKDIEKITKVFNMAVSDKIETIEFNVNNDIESGRSTGNFIESADTVWNTDVYKNKGFTKSKTKTIPIDFLAKELGITDLPDIMKIDVEGAEYLVLLGAKNILLTKKPILFIEIHSITNMFEVITFLNSLNYKTKMLKKEPSGICFVEAIPV